MHLTDRFVQYWWFINDYLLFFIFCFSFYFFVLIDFYIYLWEYTANSVNRSLFFLLFSLRLKKKVQRVVRFFLWEGGALYGKLLPVVGIRLSMGENPSICPFLKNNENEAPNGDEAPKWPSPIICSGMDRYEDFLLLLKYISIKINCILKGIVHFILHTEIKL